MELRSNIKMLNYARKYLLNDTDNILPFPVRPQKPPRTGRLPTLLPRSAPRDEGVPAAALDTLYRSLSGAECGTHACIVLRHGRVVSEGWYAPYSSRYWHVTHSMCKSVTGTAIGMLADEGRLSLDEHVCEIFPEKCGLLTSRRMREMCIRDRRKAAASPMSTGTCARRIPSAATPRPLPFTTTSVSYTHLDVYKRQILR